MEIIDQKLGNVGVQKNQNGPAVPREIERFAFTVDDRDRQPKDVIRNINTNQKQSNLILNSSYKSQDLDAIDEASLHRQTSPTIAKESYEIPFEIAKR